MWLLLFFLFLSLTSCGIKSKPKPLPEPQFQLKRIGEFVYIIGNDLEVPGFQKEEGFWFTRERKAFCFEVKRIEGKKKKVCVPEAPNQEPTVSVEELREAIKITSKDEGKFRIYKLKDGIPIPFPIGEFTKEALIEKNYSEYRVAVAKVLNENVESEPVFIKVSPKPKPVPQPPHEISYLRIDAKVVIYWFHEDIENLQGFNIYKNGKRVNKEPLKGNTFIDDYRDQTTEYEVRAVNEFGIESKGVKIYVP